MNILILDDDKNFSEYLAMTLENEKGTVVCATSSKEALEYLNSENFNLILLDYFLDGETGFNFLDSLNGMRSKPRVVLMSGSFSKDVLIDSYRHKIDGVIEKPFMSDDLLKKVDEVIGLQKELLILNEDRNMVSYQGKSFNLTAIEFSLLKVLYENRPQLVTKEKIEKTVFGDGVRARNALATHMSNLKNKLPAFGKWVQNIRGKGYIFEDNSIS